MSQSVRAWSMGSLAPWGRSGGLFLLLCLGQESQKSESKHIVWENIEHKAQAGCCLAWSFPSALSVAHPIDRNADPGIGTCASHWFLSGSDPEGPPVFHVRAFMGR